MWERTESCRLRMSEKFRKFTVEETLRRELKGQSGVSP